MAFDYGPLKTTADRLIDQFGQDCLIRGRVGNTDNLVTGTSTGGGNADVPARCVLTQITEKNAPGAVILEGDQLAILDSIIELNNRLVIDSVTWTVISIVEVKPGPTFMISKAQVRKG